MKKQLFTTFVLGASLALYSSMGIAADDAMITNNTMPMSKILSNLQEQGYSVVIKVELDDGQYKAKVIDAKGKEVKVNITPQTGEVVRPKAQASHLTMIEAVKKAEEAGYKNIYKVSSGHNEYEMKGFDKDNKKVSIDVDATTGKINKEWF